MWRIVKITLEEGRRIERRFWREREQEGAVAERARRMLREVERAWVWLIDCYASSDGRGGGPASRTMRWADRPDLGYAQGAGLGLNVSSRLL